MIQLLLWVNRNMTAHLHHEDFTGQYGKFYRSARYQNGIRTKSTWLREMLKCWVIQRFLN